MAFTGDDEYFARLITACQSRLYAYICAMVPDAEKAHDILQQANLVMLRKSDQYSRDQDFVAWACKVAYYEVLAARRDRARDRHTFSEKFFECIAGTAAERDEQFDQRQAALTRCIEKLTPRQRQMLQRRYGREGSVQQVARALGRSVASVSQMLYRIRLTLADCIRRTLAEKEA